MNAHTLFTRLPQPQRPTPTTLFRRTFRIALTPIRKRKLIQGEPAIGPPLTFRDRVADILNATGLSQPEFRTLTGISKMVIQQILHSEFSYFPNHSVMDRIAELEALLVNTLARYRSNPYRHHTQLRCFPPAQTADSRPLARVAADCRKWSNFRRWGHPRRKTSRARGATPPGGSELGQDQALEPGRPEGERGDGFITPGYDGQDAGARASAQEVE